MWLLNPAGDSIKIVEFAVTFDSAVAGTGLAVELYRTITLGSPAGTTGTQVKVDSVSDIATATTTSLIALSAEPTSSEVLAEWVMQPFGGFIGMQYPREREPFGAPAGSRLGLRCSTPAGVTTNARSYVWLEE